MLTSFNSAEPVWKPIPKQAVALACPAFELLFGGSKGGGKTGFLVACVGPLLALAHQKWLATGRPQHKCRIPVFRKNLDDLKDFTAKSYEIYPYLDPEMGPSGYNKVEKTWHFTSGATVELHHLDGPEDHLGFNGNEFAAALFDEIQFISYAAYSFLVAQVRSSDPDYRKMLMVRASANPGGPHGDWVKRHFHVDECPAGGKVFKQPVTLPDGREVVTTRAFIRSYLRDNPHLDPDGRYEAQLRNTMSPDEIRMFLDGDFDVVAGAFFSSFLRPHHFRKSFLLPSSVDLMHATDWGSSAPAATLILAKDADNTVYAIDELHTPGISGSIYGERLVERFKAQSWTLDKYWPVDSFWGVIDKQAMDKNNGPSTAGAGIMDHGFRLFEAKKERNTGVNQIKERLQPNVNGSPRLVVFEDKCPQLVKALKVIASGAPRDPEDYDHDSPYAHVMDALRFGLMEWPVVKQAKVNTVDHEVAQWERMLRKRREDAEGAANSSTTTGYGD